MNKYNLLTKCLTIMMVVLILLLGAATFIEQAKGTSFVSTHIYHTLWFCGLWAIIALLGTVALIRRAIWRRFPLLFLHGAFLVILVGALLTFIWGQQGVMHLRSGMLVDNYQLMETGEIRSLPFALKLDTFLIEHYPGTDAPSDYVSHVTYQAEEGTVSTTVSMNHILKLNGYRLYQSSFDEDQQGSWLMVNYDPWGIGVTYLGYILLGLSMIWTLFSKKEEFYKLLHHPLLKKSGLFVWLVASVLTVQGQTRTLPVLNRNQADSLSRVQVVYQDRVVPFNTLARDFVQKIYGRPSYHGFTAEQVVGGWLLSPDVWKKEPFIKVKSAALLKELGLSGKYITLEQLYEADTYRLQTLWTSVQNEPQNQLAKGILEVDEKVGLIKMLESGTLIKPVAEMPHVQPISHTRLLAELGYNRIPFTKILFMACLTLGFLSFFWMLYKGTKDTPSKSKTTNAIETFFRMALWIALLFHLAGYLLRWYIGGRIPLSNGYETMQFLALTTLVLAVLLHRRFPFTITFGFLLTGFTLLVSYLGQMNPQITPLMPVLASPLLSSHVSVIMIAYALLAFTLFNGILALALIRLHGEKDLRVEQLTLFSRLLLYPAVFFLGAGIFLGAVWANVSWGSYWSWDPKEVWALITFLIYSAAFHRSSLSWLRRPVWFHLYMILGFLAILMTYFGVNYVLGGMHSYAG